MIYLQLDEIMGFQVETPYFATMATPPIVTEEAEWMCSRRKDLPCQLRLPLLASIISDS